MIKVKIIVIVRATERGFFASVSLVIGANTYTHMYERRKKEKRHVLNCLFNQIIILFISELVQS